MSNYVLDKGYILNSAAANVKFGRAAVFDGTDNQHVTTAGAAVDVLGIYQETIDATKIAGGKATVGVRILGIARCEAGAAIARGAKVTTDSVGRVVTGGAAGTFSLGKALSPAAQAGDMIEVVLTPSNTM